MKLKKNGVAVSLIVLLTGMLLPAPHLTDVYRVGAIAPAIEPSPALELDRQLDRSWHRWRQGKGLVGLGCVLLVLGGVGFLASASRADNEYSQSMALFTVVPGAVLTLIGVGIKSSARGEIDRLEKEKQALSVGLAFDSRRKIAGIGLQFAF